MAWTLEISDAARCQFKKIDRKQADRITLVLIDIAASDAPRQRGMAMTGNYAGHWRYRFGDYRAIAMIEDRRMPILVLTVGHRREVYR